MKHSNLSHLLIFLNFLYVLLDYFFLILFFRLFILFDSFPLFHFGIFFLILCFIFLCFRVQILFLDFFTIIVYNPRVFYLDYL
jgi:hypothetical protein